MSVGLASARVRRPVRARVRQGREDRLELLAMRLQPRRQDDLRAELLERQPVDGEARPVVGDLEEDAAGLAEVDRVEVVAGDGGPGVDAAPAPPPVPPPGLGAPGAPPAAGEGARAPPAAPGG